MDLERLIENSKNKADWKLIADQVIENKRIAELVELFLKTKDKRIGQKSAGVFMTLVDYDKNIFYDFQRQLVHQLNSSLCTTTQKRNIFRLFQWVFIREEVEGELLNACITVLEQPTQPIAIRAFALTVAFRIGQRYPEIFPELEHLIEVNLELGNSAGFQNRAKKILQKIHNRA